MNILVRAPNWIGDQILAYPFFFHLRRAFPRARITVACVPWVKELQFRRQVDDVVSLARPIGDRFFDRISALEEGASRLKGRKWDLAISLPNSLSSAWLMFRAGAVRRRGYRVDARALLLNDSVDWRQGSAAHRAEAYLKLLPEEHFPRRPVSEFWGVPPENDLDPWIKGELESFEFEGEWPGFQQVPPPMGTYWVLAPGATAESRRWPVERFVQLAQLIREETGWAGAVIGSAAEAPLAEQLCRDERLGLTDLTAKGPVSGLARVLRGAKVVVCNESGLAHVASLCGAFTQIVCGAADPKRTRPLGPGRVQVAINPVECWPCERNTCSLPENSKLQCLKGIAPSMVWEEIKRGLGKP